VVRGNGNIPSSPLLPQVGHLKRRGSDIRVSSARVCLILGLMALISVTPVRMAAASVDEGFFEGAHVIMAPNVPEISPDENVQVALVEHAGYDLNDSYKTSDTGLTVLYRHDNSSLFVEIYGPSWGWVALGISTEMDIGMGFVIVAAIGSTYVAQERFAADVSDSVTFANVPGQVDDAIDYFAWTQQNSVVYAEIGLSLESAVWNMTTGTVFATVVASSMTAASSFPTSASSSQIHYLGTYLLRPQDDPGVVRALLAGDVPPMPGYVALALLTIGVVAIVYQYGIRRRKR